MTEPTLDLATIDVESCDGSTCRDIAVELQSETLSLREEVEQLRAEVASHHESCADCAHHHIRCVTCSTAPDTADDLRAQLTASQAERERLRILAQRWWDALGDGEQVPPVVAMARRAPTDRQNPHTSHLVIGREEMLANAHLIMSAPDLAEQLAEARRTIEERDAELAKARLTNDGLTKYVAMKAERDKALADLAATRGTLRHHNVHLQATRDEANGYHAERDAARERLEAFRATVAAWDDVAGVDDDDVEELRDEVDRPLKQVSPPTVDTYGIAKLERDLQAERDAHAETRRALAQLERELGYGSEPATDPKEEPALKRLVLERDALAASLELVREVWRGILEVWPRAQLDVRFYEPREDDLRPIAVQDSEYRGAGDLAEAIEALLNKGGT